MGLLKREIGGRSVSLGGRTVVGRAGGAGLQLSNPRVSAEHAVITWDGARWSVRDLGSTNGTFVDGVRIALGARVPIDRGSVLALGDVGERWTLEEEGAPTVSAVSVRTGAVRSAEDGLLALPDGTNPLVMLFEEPDGSWVLEMEGEERRRASDQETIEAGEPWILRIPTLADAVPTTHTMAGQPLLVSTALFRFDVSSDEEDVTLSLLHAGVQRRLGAKVHHEVLLVLARARREDRLRGVQAAEQGWIYVDNLLAMLKLDLQHLNVNIYRARKSLAKVGVVDAGRIVERRALARQVRFGAESIEIVAAGGM